jgi:hypothetical protein
VRGIILYLPSSASSCLICKETTLFIFTLNGSGFPKELNRLIFHALTCHLDRKAQTFSEILFYKSVLGQKYFKMMLPLLSLLRSPIDYDSVLSSVN